MTPLQLCVECNRRKTTLLQPVEAPSYLNHQRKKSSSKAVKDAFCRFELKIQWRVYKLLCQLWAPRNTKKGMFLSRRTSHEWLTTTFGWQNLGTLTHFVISLAGCIISHKLAGLVASHASMNHSTMISSPITAIFKMENCWYEGGLAWWHRMLP